MTKNETEEIESWIHKSFLVLLIIEQNSVGFSSDHSFNFLHLDNCICLNNPNLGETLKLHKLSNF